ncbi:MAG TPA: hypothetical protein VNT22_00140 [Baekduia sp.]|nr:hypothetical protein [Baekduia sp.]
MRSRKYLARLRMLSILGVFVLAMAVAGGCGSDDDGGGSGGGDSALAKGTPNEEMSQDEAVDVGLKYVGGTKGAADSAKSPIGIGLINQDTGVNAYPETTEVHKAAIKFVNEYLGGVNGHPLKLIHPQGCNASTGDAATICANELLNDDAVNVISVGWLNVGQAEFLSVVGKQKRVPVIAAGGPASIDEANLPSAYFLAGGFFSSAAITYWKDYAKVKSIAQIWPGGPGVQEFADIYATQLKAGGLDPKVVIVPPNSTDIVAPLLAAKAGDKDAIEFFAGSGAQCIAAANAVEQLRLTDKLTVGYSACFNSALKKEYPSGDIPTWTTGDVTKNLLIKDDSGQVGAMIVAMKAQAGEKWLEMLSKYYTPTYFGSVMFITKIMNEVGGDTPEYGGIVDAIKAYRGPLWTGPDKATFGTPGLPSVGTTQQIFSKHEGGGKWTYVSPFVEGPVQ